MENTTIIRGITAFNHMAKLVFCGKRGVRPKRDTNWVEEETAITYVPYIA
jgi:hypothetical protein